MFRSTLSFFLLVMLTSGAQAYIDPGAGMLALQGVIAAVAGGLLAFKMYWRRLKAWMTGKKIADSDDNKHR